MTNQDGEILQLKAHGSRYSMYVSNGLGSGLAPSKVERNMRRGRPYESHLLELIYDMHLEGVAVDVGANVGNHTMWLAAICGLEVHAFEPIPNVYAELRANVELNDLNERVTTYNVGLSDRVGYAVHEGKGVLRSTEDDTQLPTRPLDGYDLEDVVVMKIDVEGSEPWVLRGAERTIRTQQPIIFAEEWDLPEHAEIAAVLEPWGYRMVDRLSGRRAATAMGCWEYVS